MSEDRREELILDFVAKDIQLIKKTCSFKIHDNCQIRSFDFSEIVLLSVYSYIRGRVMEKLGYELNTNFEDAETLKVLSDDLASTHRKIFKGALLVKQNSNLNIKEFAKPVFLYLFESNDNSIEREEISRSYYLLSLIDIALFEEIYFDSDLYTFDFSEINDGRIAESIIKTQSILMRAQLSAEMAMNSLHGYARADNRSMMDFIKKNWSAIETRENLRVKARESGKNAAEYWEPYLKEVQKHINEKEKTPTSACDIVARKYDLNSGTLRNRYNKLKAKN